MGTASDNERVTAEAVTALPDIAAALDPSQQPAGADDLAQDAVDAGWDDVRLVVHVTGDVLGG